MSNYAILSYAQFMLEVFLYLDMYIYRNYMILRTSMNKLRFQKRHFSTKSEHFHIGTNYWVILAPTTALVGDV